MCQTGKQRNILNGKFSSWKYVNAVLSPLLFLTYINNLTNTLISSTKCCVDDTSIALSVENSCDYLNTNTTVNNQSAYQ